MSCGRGSLGFRKVVRTELSGQHPLRTEITRRQDFPFTGLTESVVVRQASGKAISSTDHQWAKLDIGTLMNARRFPYASTTTIRRYEAGGPLDGIEIVRIVRAVAAIDAASGLVTDETTTTTEIGGGANPVRPRACARFTQASSMTRELVPRAFAGSPDHREPLACPAARRSRARRTRVGTALKCRPTRIRLLPGDSQWQVTYNLSYDAFGNVANEKVTGAGMPQRSVAINWGSRGQLPVRMTNPLAQVTRYTWDEGGGLPLTLADPNGVMMRWDYDAFGRLSLEIAARWHEHALDPRGLQGWMRRAHEVPDPAGRSRQRRRHASRVLARSRPARSWIPARDPAGRRRPFRLDNRVRRSRSTHAALSAALGR